MSKKLYPLEEIPNSHNNGTRETVEENIKNNKNLLISIGDSWTWGDSLGKTSLNYNDKKSRHVQFYTNKLAKKLNCDWLMIAYCGTDNSWILDQYEIIKEAIDKGYYKKYNKIYVHVCLTELFRELQHEHIKYAINKKLNKIKNFDNFCKEYFKITILNRLKKISPIPKLHFFSKNFWNISMNYNKYNFVKNTWQELLFKKTNIKDNKFLPVLSGVGITPLIKFLKENKLKNLTYDFSNLLVKINKRVDNIIGCPLNYKKATKHPTAEGHQIWADYLYNYYKDL